MQRRPTPFKANSLPTGGVSHVGGVVSKYADKRFWVDTFDRAVATFAQAAVATLTAGVTGILDVDWVQVASVSGLAAGVSVLTSVAFRGGAQEGK